MTARGLRRLEPPTRRTVEIGDAAASLFPRACLTRALHFPRPGHVSSRRGLYGRFSKD
jgi:hypothetical protein